MFEIEAKVWIKDQKQWNDLLKKVAEENPFKGEETKEDLYFCKQGQQKPLFRLRTYNNKKWEVTIKDKEIIKGIEQSKEESFSIDNKDTFLSFTKQLGFDVLLQKTKHSLLYSQNDLTIELNTIKNLGNFLEIEVICNDKSQIKSAQQKIESCFAQYGFSQNDFEARPYYQLLT